MSSLFEELFCDMTGFKSEDLEIANEVSKEFFGIDFIEQIKKDEENDRKEKRNLQN